MASPAPTMFPVILVAADGMTAIIVGDLNSYNAAVAAGATYSAVLPSVQISSAGGQTVTVLPLPLTSVQTDASH